MRLSFDYLVGALQSLDDITYYYKDDISHGKLALGERQALIQSGLVVSYQKRGKQHRGLGRCRKAYRLAQPYNTIQVGQLVTQDYPISDFDRHLFTRLGEVKLTQLDNVVLSPITDISSRYSAEKLITCLGTLPDNHFVPLHPTLYRVTSVARRIMNDMAHIGLVDICQTPIRGYKLARSLAHVPVDLLLPYLCSMSVNRQYYNRLFYAVKNHPVSLLMIP